jgi:hypothetical protein
MRDCDARVVAEFELEAESAGAVAATATHAAAASETKPMAARFNIDYSRA